MPKLSTTFFNILYQMLAFEIIWKQKFTYENKPFHI